MPNYYNITTFERQDIPQDLIDLWAATSNPKLAQYELTPPAPSPDAAWANGQWVLPPAPTWTAESWLDHQGYSGNRPTTLLYQKLRLDASSKSSPKLNAVQAWLDSMIASGLAPAASNWPAAPHSFEATLTETLVLLE
jgi:hypothetical protein